MRREMLGKDIENNVQSSIGIQIKIAYEADDFLPNRPSTVFDYRI